MFDVQERQRPLRTPLVAPFRSVTVLVEAAIDDRV
jgi:hypothetical protein